VNLIADASAWIEYLRDTGSPTSVELERCLRAGDLLVTDVVAMEIAVGARDDAEEAALLALLARAIPVPTEPDDWLAAARLQRRCRAAGQAVRRMTDCLIAAVAIRAGVAVLHCDQDFDTLARHTPLRVLSG
jgi:predicted nucleic acid-binding protein